MVLKGYKNIIINAVIEDLGKGDITSKAIIPSDKKAKAVIIAKQDGVVAGVLFLKEMFSVVDSKTKITPKVKDGKAVKKGTVIAQIQGSARSILACERTALNMLSHLSGIATVTNQFVKKVKGYRVKILDTRKTLPCLRILQKYAVKTGGGTNHRMGLYDQVLIKDNHIAVVSSQYAGVRGKRKTQAVKEAVKRARKNAPKHMKIEIEVNNLAEFQAALKERPDIIMLDNMTIAQMKKAARLRGKLPILLEASGNVRLENIRKIAATGVDTISIGALTNSARAIDFSLEII